MEQNDREKYESEQNTMDMDTLVAEHRKLDEQVSTLAEQHFLSPEQTLELTRLKKEKLRIKDRIAGLSHIRASA